jgi:hypothetical protein
LLHPIDNCTKPVDEGDDETFNSIFDGFIASPLVSATAYRPFARALLTRCRDEPAPALIAKTPLAEINRNGVTIANFLDARIKAPPDPERPGTTPRQRTFVFFQLSKARIDSVASFVVTQSEALDSPRGPLKADRGFEEQVEQIDT